MTSTMVTKYHFHKSLTFDSNMIHKKIKPKRGGDISWVLNLAKLNLDDYERAKKSIYGGRSIIRQKIKICIRCKNLYDSVGQNPQEKWNQIGCKYCSICADIKGMYNSVMIDYKYPVGLPHKITNDETKKIMKICDLFHEDEISKSRLST